MITKSSKNRNQTFFVFSLMAFMMATILPRQVLAAGKTVSSNSGLFALTSLHVGSGTSANSTASIQKRTMLFTEATADLGYSFGMLAPIAHVSYRYVGQQTDPSSVSDTNMAGTGYIGGAGLSADFGAIRLVASYDLLGSFQLSQKSSGGSVITYTKPTGYHVKLNYAWQGNWEFSATYTREDYKTKKSDSSETDIKDDAVYQTLYGVGLSYLF